MKILTLNTWQKNGPWKERWEVIFPGLEALEPDIVAFQELYDEAWAQQIQKRTAYPFLVHPLDRGGLAILSRLPVTQSTLYTMDTRSPFEDYFRYVLWAEVSWQDQILEVFNTHLSWKPEDGATRKAQLEELWQWARPRLKGAGAVLVGDLNAPPYSEEIGWFQKASGWTDAFNALHPEEPGYSWDNRNRFTAGHKPPLPDRRLDYVFLGGANLARSLTSCELAFTQPGARGVFASDHYGVLGQLSES